MSRINYTLAQFRRTQAALELVTQPSGRLSLYPAGTTASLMRAESVLVRVVSIAESFCFGELSRHLESQAPQPRGAFVEKLYLDAEERATSTWPNATTAFKTWVKVTLTEQGDTWQSFQAIVEARNAVMHGLGSFTSRQRRAKGFADLQKRLTTLSFDVSCDRVRVTPGAMKTATQLSVDVITWVDGKLPTLSR